jgi:outer membrane protein TolC
LEQVLQYADKNSLVTKQSVLQLAISQKEETINKSGLLPKLNLFNTADYYPIITTQLIPESIFGGASDKFRKVQFGLPLSLAAGAELTVPVINFERWEQLKRIKLQSQQTDWNSKANIESLHIQLTQWYYQGLLAAQLLQLNKSNQQVTDELLRVLEERKKNGVLNPADFNRSKNLQLDMQTAGVEYAKNLRQSIIVLKQLLNLPDSVSLQLMDSVSGKDLLLQHDENDISKRPGWQEAAAKIAVAQQQLKELQKAALPKIAFTGKYTYQWQMKPSSGEHVNFDYSSMGLRLDFPVFQGSFYRASRQKSELQLRLANTAQQQTVNELTRQQAEWRNSYAAAVQKQSLLQQKMAVAAENLRIAQLNVKEGVMEFDEFNNIFQEYNKARLDNLQNLSDGIVYQLLLNIK